MTSDAERAVYATNALYLVPASFSICLNLAVVYTFMRSRALRRREYYLPCCLAIADGSYSLAAALVSAYRMTLIVEGTYNTMIPKLHCFLNPGANLAVLTMALMPLINLAICVDRLIAVNTLLYYSTLTGRYVAKILIGSVGVSVALWVVFVGATLFNYSLDELRTMRVRARCSALEAFSSPYWYLYEWYFTCACFIVVGVLTIVIAVCVNVQSRRFHVGEVDAATVKRNRRITQMLMYCMTSSMMLFTIPMSMFALHAMTHVFGEHGELLGHVASVAAQTNCLNDALFFCWKNGEFRREMARVCLPCMPGVYKSMQAKTEIQPTDHQTTNRY